MRAVDELLEDDELVGGVFDAQGQRHAQSRTRGWHQTPAVVVLRMLILKHVRNWSYETLEREVRANVVYRSFCRIGMEKVPDAKTLVRLGQAVGPEGPRGLHDRLVAIAQERKVIQGRKMRVDTTVVESNIHYPTDTRIEEFQGEVRAGIPGCDDHAPTPARLSPWTSSSKPDLSQRQSNGPCFARPPRCWRSGAEAA